MIHVYLLEDHAGLRDATTFSLNAQHDLLVQGAANGTQFAALCAHKLPDIAIFDRMLPGEDGFTIAQQLRDTSDAKKVGIIFLTALGCLDDKLQGLELSDAYLVKPVDMRELTAVIRSVYRRINFTADNGTRGLWRILRNRLELISPQGNLVELTYKEMRILCALATSSKNNLVSIRTLVEIMEEDWLLYEKNRLELLLSRLRQKIRTTGELSINPIKSARNEGYQLTLPMLVVDA